MAVNLTNLVVTALLSFAVSAVVSGMTFVAGFRAGKNNADRQVLRALYQELFEHYSKMLDAIDAGYPKHWSNYKLIGNRYVPLTRELHEAGRLSMLPSSLGRRLLSTEADVLNAGAQYSQAIRDNYSPAAVALIVGSGLSTSTWMSQFQELRISQIAVDPSVLRSLLGDKSCAYSLGRPPGTPAGQSLYICPVNAGDEDKLEQLVRRLFGLRDEPTMAEARAALNARRKEIVSLIDLSSRRIRDPHPLSATLAELRSDLFPLK